MTLAQDELVASREALRLFRNIISTPHHLHACLSRRFRALP